MTNESHKKSIDLIAQAKTYVKQEKLSEANALLTKVHEKDEHSFESALMFGLLSEKLGNNFIAFDAFFKALVLNPYDNQAIEGFQRYAQRALPASTSRFYSVKGFVEYCKDWLIPYKKFKVSDDSDFEQIFIELEQIHSVGQSMRIFSSDLTYLMEDFDLLCPDENDVVSTTQMRNIVAYKKPSRRISFPQVLALIPKEKTNIKKCIVLSKRASDNYFHWLLELIPSLIIMEKHKEFDDLPILVNGHMPRQHYQVLDAVLQGKRKVFLAQNNSHIQIEKAIIPLNLNRIVFDPLPNKKITVDDVYFHPFAIECLRQKLGKFHEEKDAKKVYLSRKSSSLKKRKMHNQEEVELIFQEYGFEIVDTGELDFIEQVSLFTNANVIAGATGASFTNLVFCSDDTEIVFLTPPQNNIGIYFRTLAKACGLNNWSEVDTHPIESSGEEQFHGDFSVSIGHLKSVLDRVR